MKVYIVTNEAYPHGMAAALRITCYAKALLMVGIGVEVVIYFRSEISNKPRNTLLSGTHNGVEYRYVCDTTIREKSLLKRKFYDYRDRTKAIKYLKTHMVKGDAILAYLRQDVFTKSLIRFAHNHKYPIVRDFCEYPYATTNIEKDTEEKCIKYMKDIFKSFDGSICISENLLTLARTYNPNGNHIKVPILIDESNKDFSKVRAKELDYKYIFHAGTLYQQKDGILDVLDAFSRAIKKLPNNTKYIFTGYLEASPDAESIRNKITNLGLEENVLFLGYLSDIELLEYEKGASLFIINKLDNLQNKYCFATKIGEYLLTGNPVLITNIGETNQYLTNRHSAYIVEHNNILQMADTIIYALTHSKESKEIGFKGRQVAKKSFTVASQSNSLKLFFEELVCTSI